MTPSSRRGARSGSRRIFDLDAFDVAALTVIVLATLLPTGSRPPPPELLCLECGDRPLADAVLNLLLCLPLGAALSRRKGGWLTALLAGAVLSGMIESVQLLIPGRSTTIRDLLANTLGAGLGGAAFHGWRVRDRLPRWGLRAACIVAVMAAVAVEAGGRFFSDFAPAPGLGEVRARWNPRVDGVRPYEGRLVAVTAYGIQTAEGPEADGEKSLDAGPIAAGPGFSAFGAEGRGLRLTFDAVAPPREPAPLLHIYQTGEGDVLTVLIEGDDLLVSPRARATEVGLMEPVVRITDAVAGARPGERITVLIRRVEGRLCAIRERDAVACSRVPTEAPGRGWSLVLPVSPPSAWLVPILDIASVGGLFVPAGFLAPGIATLGAAAALVLAAVGGSVLAGVGSWLDLVIVLPGLISGLTAGFLMAGRVGLRRPSRRPGSGSRRGQSGWGRTEESTATERVIRA